MDARIAPQLLATFFEELDEHVRTLNGELLALERAGVAIPEAGRVTTLLRAAHSLKGAARVVDVGAVEAGCHELEEILVGVRDGGRTLGAETYPTLFAIVDRLAAESARLRAGAPSPAPEPPPAGTTRPPSAEGRPDAAVERGGPPPAGSNAAAMVRVGTERLDALLADSGELLVGWRRLEASRDVLVALHEQVGRWSREWRGLDRVVRRLVGAEAEPAVPRRAAVMLADTAGRLARIERELEQLSVGLAADSHAVGLVAARLDDDVRRVRMLPFSDGCAGLARTVRDLSRAVAKDVELVVEGGDVELDRSVLESVKDPLLQLVRNAVDHGIEPPVERRAAGKRVEGRIVVSASLRNGRVEVIVADDGRGLDLDGLRAKARAKGLPEPRDAEQLAYVVFEAGLSTAAAVTDLSGRGVGLDVVRSRILGLGGTIDLASEPGRGTRFTLSLPLTLTTMRALFVAAGGETFAIGSTHVEGIVRVPHGSGPRVQGREVLTRNDEIVPVVPLVDVLGLPAEVPSGDGGATRPAVLVAAGALRVALLVDEILTEHEVVVKSLGARLQGLRQISGATLLPSGRVALVLNAAAIVPSASECRPSRLPATPAAAAAVVRRILVVDDSLTTRSLERSILEAAGYEVAVASDGEVALRVLEEGGADLIVCDVEMPRLDGLALTEAVRASSRWRGIPIVLVTGRESPADRTRGLEVGADAYLVKSAFDQQVLLETVAQLL